LQLCFGWFLKLGSEESRRRETQGREQGNYKEASTHKAVLEILTT